MSPHDTRRPRIRGQRPQPAQDPDRIATPRGYTWATTRRRRVPARTRRGPRRRAVALLVLAVIAIGLALMGIRAAAGTRPTQPAHAPADVQPARSVSAAQPQALIPGAAPHACQAFAPTSGDRKITVFVDPGHGGLDPGVSSQTSAGALLNEKDVTLAVGLDLLPLLRADGYRVVMSRTVDTLVAQPASGDVQGNLLTAAGLHHDLVERVACANAAGADLLLSIHFNAYDDPGINGAETLYDSSRPFATSSRRLAGLVQQHVLATLRNAGWDVPDRGVLDDQAAGTPALTNEGAQYGHLLELGPAAQGWLDRPSAMPGVLTEPLFLTHPAEADVAADPHGRQLIAEGLAQAIDAYFAAPRATPTAPA